MDHHISSIIGEMPSLEILRYHRTLCRQENWLEPIPRCLLKLGNGGFQIVGLPDSIHISPEHLYEYKMIPTLQSGNPVGTLLRRYLQTLIKPPWS